MQRTPDDRFLPHNLEAERAILGAILFDNQKLASVNLEPSDFYDKRHQEIFRMMKSLVTDKKPFDTIVLKDELHFHQKLAAAGGPAYVANLTDGIPLGLELSHYVQIIKNKTHYRDLVRFSEEFMTRGLQAEDSPEQLTAEAQAALTKLKVIFRDAPPAFSVERLEEESRKLPAGKPSGWESLDKIGVSFHAGELAVIGGRTGHCKTSVLVGLLVNWLNAGAENEDDGLIILYSAEEPEVRIFHRLLNLLTVKGNESSPSDWWTVNEIRDYRRDIYSREKWPIPDSLDKAKELLLSWEPRLLIVHRPAWTVSELEIHARHQAQERRIGAVLVDYLQRIPPPAGRYDRRDIEVSTVGRRLKSLAVELSVPVVAGAQINREAIPAQYGPKISIRSYEDAKKVIQDARPDLSHLREGGCEQEADLVLGLLNYAADYRSDADRQLPDATLLEFGTLKNRYGDVGRWVSMDFRRKYGLIQDAQDPVPF